MGFYDRYVLPRMIHLACSSKPNMKQREKLVLVTLLKNGLGESRWSEFFQKRGEPIRFGYIWRISAARSSLIDFTPVKVAFAYAIYHHD